MARTKLTEELIQNARILIEEGNFESVVAQALGVTRQTWYNWKIQAETLVKDIENETLEEENLSEQDLNLLLFLREIKLAEVQAEMVSLARIRQHAKKNWQADAWFLERKFPDRWKLKMDVEVAATVSVDEKKASLLDNLSGILERSKSNLPPQDTSLERELAEAVGMDTDELTREQQKELFKKSDKHV